MSDTRESTTGVEHKFCPNPANISDVMAEATNRLATGDLENYRQWAENNALDNESQRELVAALAAEVDAGRDGDEVLAQLYQGNLHSVFGLGLHASLTKEPEAFIPSVVGEANRLAARWFIDTYVSPDSLQYAPIYPTDILLDEIAPDIEQYTASVLTLNASAAETNIPNVRNIFTELDDPQESEPTPLTDAEIVAEMQNQIVLPADINEHADGPTRVAKVVHDSAIHVGSEIVILKAAPERLLFNYLIRRQPHEALTLVEMCRALALYLPHEAAAKSILKPLLETMQQSGLLTATEKGRENKWRTWAISQDLEWQDLRNTGEATDNPIETARRLRRKENPIESPKPVRLHPRQIYLTNGSERPLQRRTREALQREFGDTCLDIMANPGATDIDEGSGSYWLHTALIHPVRGLVTLQLYLPKHEIGRPTLSANVRSADPALPKNARTIVNWAGGNHRAYTRNYVPGMEVPDGYDRQAGRWQGLWEDFRDEYLAFNYGAVAITTDKEPPDYKKPLTPVSTRLLRSVEQIVTASSPYEARESTSQSKLDALNRHARSSLSV